MAGSQQSQLTPMMAQYRQIKSQLPANTLLLFHLGDFYELFYEDAKIGSSVLGLVLTKRNGVPMCGIPQHSASTYIGRLLKAGYRVALCDQLEEPRPGKLVKRDVTQILSPGTHLDERILEADRNNYLAAVCRIGRLYGFAYVDLTTGEFKVTETESESRLLTELAAVRPTEIIYPAEDTKLLELLRGNRSPSDQPQNFVYLGAESRWVLNGYEDWVFDAGVATQVLSEHFKVLTLDGFGLKGCPAATAAAGAVIHYLTHQLRREVRHVTRVVLYHQTGYLLLDPSTLRNLEVLEPLSKDAPNNACLYGVLNRTVTPMGARRLRQWLAKPLADLAQIERRHAAVEAFVRFPHLLEQFRKQLGEVRDLERTLSRLSSGGANARDLIGLRVALEQLPGLRDTLRELIDAVRREKPGTLFTSADAGDSNDASYLLEELLEDLEPRPHLVELIKRAIVDDPPATVKEGGIIKDGFDPHLDELRSAMRNGREWIAQLQQREIQRTGIQSLKIRYNAVFGYYIEVTKANLDKVPPDYIRKQTLTGAERFITPELKEMESKLLGAEERSIKLEYEIFQRVREQVLADLVDIQRAANALATLDVLASFAEVARLNNYCRPIMRDEGLLVIKDGRHPVLEQFMVGERFVPNDTELGASISPSIGLGEPSSGSAEGSQVRLPQIALITGPNMAGKSTYVRQVALITLMAHVGSFVPAREARIDLVDRIFTRIGAGDDLARGQSTFMVEMTETANILNNATPKSLIILDEVGRGTSTFDGLALAWSIVEYIHNRVGAKTLFATHYHELTELGSRLPRLRNYNVAVREWNDQIIFLHKIVLGATDRSYGLHVARLAGVPPDVIERAKVILSNLEEVELTPDGGKRSTRRERDRERLRGIQPPSQLDLFS